jgi:hypothetical protein
LIKFKSPFEKTYILLKLSRSERPFIEPVFQKFITSQEVYSETVASEAKDQLQKADWLTFINEISVT